MAVASHLCDAERRFVDYAAHELRSEIALQLALAESTLADPNADTTALRNMGECIAAACQRQERLLEALLTLARSQYGKLRREPVDLAAITAEVLQAQGHPGLRRTAALKPARTNGDSQLIRRLIANLISNAIRHNIRGGRLDIATHNAGGRATFTITNTGQAVPSGDLPRLFQPFQQAHAGPSTHGVGLGLAIVQAIADAHDATVAAQAQTGGGLRIHVDFPPSPSPTQLGSPRQR